MGHRLSTTGSSDSALGDPSPPLPKVTPALRCSLSATECVRTLRRTDSWGPRGSSTGPPARLPHSSAEPVFDCMAICDSPIRFPIPQSLMSASYLIVSNLFSPRRHLLSSKPCPLYAVLPYASQKSWTNKIITLFILFYERDRQTEALQ